MIDSGIDQCSEPGAVARPEAELRLCPHGRVRAQCDCSASNEWREPRSHHCYSAGARRDAIEELEDRRPNHRHHAAVVAVDLEVLEVEATRAHELRERPAAGERGRGAGSFRHEDGQTADIGRRDTTPYL